MKPPIRPSDEVQRLAALRDYEIHEGGEDLALDDLTALAAFICGAPIALITLVEDNRQWFKSKVGMSISETARDISFCAHAIHQRDLFVVPDTAEDERFSDNPLVTADPQIRFYAAAPLVTPAGQALGTICVIDRVVRTLSLTQMEALRALSRQVMAQLELHRKARELIRREEALLEARRFAQATIDALSSEVCVLDENGLILAANTAWRVCAEGNPPEPRNASAGENYLAVCDTATGPGASDAKAFAAGIRAVLRGELPVFTMEYPCHAPQERRWVMGRVTRFPGNGPARVAVAHENSTERHLTEERLRASEARYRRAEIGTNDGLWEWTIATGEEYVSPRWLEMLGYSQGDLSLNFAGFTSLIHPDDRAKVAAEAELSLRDLRPFRMEMRLRCKDGAYLWVLSRGMPDLDPGGKPVCMTGSLSDISGRKRGEMALLESEANYRLLFEHLPIPVWVEDFSAVKEALDRLKAGGVTDFASHFRSHPDQVKELTALIRVIDVNSAVLTVHRAATKEQLLQNLALVFTESTYRVLAEEFAWMADGKLAFDLEEDVRKLDGEPMRVISRLTVSPGHEDTWKRVLVSVMDITGRKVAEDKLREGDALLVKVSKQVPGVLYQFQLFPDGRSCFPYASDGLRIIYELSPSEVRDSADKVFSLVHRDDLDAVSASIDKSAGTLEPWHCVYRVVLPVRGLRWLEGDSVPEKLGDGSILWHGYIRDITERHVMEQQFLRAQRMDSIGTLAGGVAHDLNNVLAPILLALGLLREKVQDKEDEGLILALQKSANRGADLVKQVLTFARGLDGQRVTINLVYLLRDLEKMMRDSFPKSVECGLVTDRDIWTVTGDPTQIHQIFLNLCINARDAMPDGGKLNIVLENVVLDEAYAGMNPDSKAGAYVVVKVSDTGTGIPAPLRERIFEPFFTTKEVGKGTGLGLSTTLAIVKSHKGFINLYSEVGHGTTFKIYLPANTTISAAEHVAIENSGLPRGDGETILVVDDEEGIRNIAQRTLERFGYRVLLAIHGAQAVAVYAEHRAEIAVVLTDMSMPVMDGPALILALVSMNPGVLIVASSGLNANGGVAKALGAGVKHFVPKPYTAEAILKTLAEILKKG